MNAENKIIKKAEVWAAGLWEKAQSRWTVRLGQDKNYRSYVIHPALLSIINKLYKDEPVNVLDLGCGDGIFLEEKANREILNKNGTYLGVDISEQSIKQAQSLHNNPNVNFIQGNLTDPGLPKLIEEKGKVWNCIISVFTIQEIPDLNSFLKNLGAIVQDGSYALIVTVHPEFAEWLKENGRMRVENDLNYPVGANSAGIDLSFWHWAGQYPIVDEPLKSFYLPYFHRTVEEYSDAFERTDFYVEQEIELPDRKKDLPRLVNEKISPYTQFESNLYWPRIAESYSSLVFVLRKESKKARKAVKKSFGVPAHTAGGRSYEDLRARFLEILGSYSEPVHLKTFTAPELYARDRVTYIIPPITDVEHRSEWKPGNIYVVKKGNVAIGRVFYTRTSGEFLIEELILRKGDIFGEFEVPLSILGSPALWQAKLPPRFNMTYGAWATGPALNWAMAYPRYIERDSVDPENPNVAVHPFYIKSKNIRPRTDAEVYTIPIDYFEKMVGEHPEVMTWFLMNVLWKNRLYFESPAQGYGRSPANTIARLMIRILAYRIRLGVVILGKESRRITCSTFIGPAEWLKYGLGSFAADLMEVVRSVGASSRETVRLPVFTGELANTIELTWHMPVKDLDDDMLVAMGCSPETDRHENRFGLLTGIKIDLNDLDFFKKYLLEKGE
ncbi:MAG: class I SAM-dependent methyltransferase [Candidatus Latescibacteria bacterium]|nr:class I SAM-dependent methyltransferase [Candidatus Latescibacterota bacterium]